ncbi:PAS domain S-box protein [Thiovibrio sp. JS02]
MSAKKQAIILLSVVLLILAGLFLYHVQQLESRIFNLMIESDARELHATAQTLQRYSYAKYRDRIKNLLLAAPAIVEAFAEGDRARLYAATRNKYDSLQRENPYFHVMQFHLPNGDVFLRMHRPYFPGNFPGGVRPLVAAVHQGRAALSGFEFCEEGLLFRVVYPVFAQERYVGAVELGIRAQEMIAAIEENLGEKVSSYFLADQWARAARPLDQQVTRRGRFVVVAERTSSVARLPPGFYEEEHELTLKQEGRSFRVHNHQIFKDFKGESIGGILFLQDISAAMHRKQAFLGKAVLVTFLLFLVAATVLYTSFERIWGSLVREIAVRKQAEVALHERERQVRLLLDSTAEGIFGLDQEGKCTFVNKSCLKLLGYENEDEWLGATLHDLIHNRRADGSDFPKAECPMCCSYHGGQEVSVDDEVLWRKDGQAIPVEYHAYPIRQGSRLLGSVVTFSDIGRRKQAEEDKKRLAAAIEHTVDEIIITDPAGLIEYVNPAFERVTGYSREEVIGKTPNVLTSGKHPKEYYRNLWATIRGGEVWSSHIINRAKSGAFLEEDATISPIFDAGGRAIGYVAVIRDVTEKVRMEERLRQANKMESLGTLAGAIAHDFNNILSGIIGFTTLSLSEVPAKSEVAENLNGIMRASETATELVRQILAFSRKGSSEFKPIAVQEVAKDVVKFLRCIMPATIRIEARIDMACGPVWGNASQIYQVIMNLGTNAYHAMRERGGVLTVCLEEKTQGARKHKTGDQPARVVLLRITDTGAGISSEALARIFDPYFTTKKEGEGTGLGLATVREIVKSHQGDIEVQSELARGTTFSITLPICRKTQAVAEEIQGDSDFLELGIRVLVVDDTAINVMLTQEILQSAGCEVTGLSDSVQALEIFRQRPDQFDLVVTDQVMPELAGDELVRQMLRIRPDLPVIMVTGDENPVGDADLGKGGIRELLVKPISVKDLLAAAAKAVAPAAPKGN